MLKASGAKRAFLIGPLTLKRGVTLVVDTNAIVFALARPAPYDIEPGRCGTVDEKGHGCSALITAERAMGAGVMGPGTIDGRGWAKLLGKDVSWWDLAQDAKVQQPEPELSAPDSDQSHPTTSRSTRSRSRTRRTSTSSTIAATASRRGAS